MSETFKREIVYRFYRQKKDIADIAEKMSLDFFEVLEVLRPYMERAKKKNYSKIKKSLVWW